MRRAAALVHGYAPAARGVEAIARSRTPLFILPWLTSGSATYGANDRCPDRPSSNYPASAKSDGIMSLYDAGIIAVYLVVLASGVLRVVDGEETLGWIEIIVAAGFWLEDVFLVQPARTQIAPS